MVLIWLTSRVYGLCSFSGSPNLVASKKFGPFFGPVHSIGRLRENVRLPGRPIPCYSGRPKNRAAVCHLKGGEGPTLAKELLFRGAHMAVGQNQWYHFGLGALPHFGLFLVGIGMATAMWL